MSALGLSTNDGDGGCSFLAAYRRASGSSLWAWSSGWRPSGAVLHSSREPGARRPCSDFMDMFRLRINCHIIIIIISDYECNKRIVDSIVIAAKLSSVLCCRH